MDRMGWDAATIQYMVGLLLNRRVPVPTDFRAQCQAVKTIYDSDSSGLVDSISDKMVENASTKFYFESLKNYSGFESLLNEWCERLNEDLRGYGIKTGIEGLQEQYYKERWKYSSFPVIRYGNWKYIGNGNNKLRVPMTVIVLDGCAIVAKDKDNTDGDLLGLFPYDYYLGDSGKYKIGVDKHLITKPFDRPFDKLPKPFIVRRGIYQNWKLIYDIENKQDELLSKIIPYYLLLKRGLGSKNVGDDKLEKTVLKLQEALDKLNTGDKVPVHASNSDSSLEHLIPNMENMFKQELFSHSEKAIIAGFGLIDIYDSGIASRKESVLNPKGFMSELLKGQSDFKSIMNDLLAIIKLDNDNKLKYNKEKVIPRMIPPREYLTKEIKEDLHKAHGRGNLAERTYNELVVDAPFEIEIKRRQYEAVEGIEEDLYARVIQNTENISGFDIPQSTNKNTGDDEKVPDDKRQGVSTKEKYTVASVENIPFNRDEYPRELGELWDRVFANAIQLTGSQSEAHRAAWKAIRKKAKIMKVAGTIDAKTFKKLVISVKTTDEEK